MQLLFDIETFVTALAINATVAIGNIIVTSQDRGALVAAELSDEQTVLSFDRNVERLDCESTRFSGPELQPFLGVRFFRR